MAEDDDSKTEQPSSRKLSQAREEGDITQSQEVKTAAMLSAITVLVWFVLPITMSRITQYLAALLAAPHALAVGTEFELMKLLSGLASHLALAVLIPFGVLLFAAFASNFAQTGWLITASKITPDLSKINPMKGLKRIFSLPGLVEFTKNMAKLTVMAALFYMIMRARVQVLPLLPTMELPAILEFLHQSVLRLVFAIALVDIFIAGADYAFQRFNFLKKLRMTKQEVKDEHRQSEGDPMVKARLRQLRMQRARQRMMASVPKADVIVTNPTHFACALKYDAETMSAPMLVAKGQDLVALRIRELAEQHDITIVENPPLARALYASVEIDREIPPEHYKAVAEVISYVFRLKGKFRRPAK
jgi:flagellar biosynthetic protein FlhB